MPRIDEVLVPDSARPASPSARCWRRPIRDKMRQHLEKARIDDARIAELERAIDAGDAELEPLQFVHPARRHAEGRRRCTSRARSVAAPSGASSGSAARPRFPQLVVIYLNRLSDLLFTLARVANRRAGTGEVTW